MERPGELFLDYFWLITNLKRNRYSGARLLGLYRMRGKAEGHMGEFMDVLAPALSSAPRAKSHYRGRRLEAVTEPEEAGVRAQNSERDAVAAEPAEPAGLRGAARRAVCDGAATGIGWSLRGLRERVPSRVVRHGRRLTFVIAQDSAPDWQRLWGKLAALDWVPSLGGAPIGSRAFCYGPYHVRPIRSAGSANRQTRPADLSTSAPSNHEPPPTSALSPIRPAKPPRILNSANFRTGG